MLTLLTKPKPWMFAAVFAAASVFAKTPQQCFPAKSCPQPAKSCPQPTPPTQVCPGGDPCCPAWSTPVLNAAYNYPARIQTRCPWNVYFDASFIYWQPTEDNLEIGFANTTGLVSSGSTSTNGINGNFVNMDFDFKPGFKVGMGFDFDHDNWDMHAEYTWLHSTDSASATSPAGGQIIRLVSAPATVITNGLYSSVQGSWKLKMDIVDLDIGRWCYVGTKLTFRPNFGVRADWIRQKVSNVASRTATTTPVTIGADVATVNQRTVSWALGPKVGLDANWNLAWGLRFFGNTEADLLFTDYTRLKYSETHSAAASGVGLPFSTKQTKVYCVRPHLDLELGFGWGTYFDCNGWYLDFALGYEFQVFFNQNMFRHFDSFTIPVSSIMPNGDLYLQGLTATFRLDF